MRLAFLGYFVGEGKWTPLGNRVRRVLVDPDGTIENEK